MTKMSSTGAANLRPARAIPNSAPMSTLTRFLWPVVIAAGLGAALGYYGECTSGTCPLTSTWWRGALYGSVFGIIWAVGRRPTP